MFAYYACIVYGGDLCDDNAKKVLLLGTGDK